MLKRFIRRGKLDLFITTAMTIFLLVNLSVFPCSGFIAQGDATAGPTISGQTVDVSYTTRPHYVGMEVNEETGIKNIGTGDYGKLSGDLVYRVNSHGVSELWLAMGRIPGANAEGKAFVDADEGYIVELAYMVKDYPDVNIKSFNWILERATSAKEAVKLLTEGLPKEIYNVFGPLTDIAYAQSNTLIYKPFIKYLADPLYSLNRQERIQELLDRRRDEQGKNKQVNALYAFSILRDRQYKEEYSRSSDNRGNISRFAYAGGTQSAGLNELPSKHPELLSIHWRTLNYPPTSPFLPFYIGLPEIPPTFAQGPDNEVNVFNELFNAVSYKMDYMDDVQKFWEAFEFQTVREKPEIESEVIQLADKGNKEGAQSILYDFVNKKCELAVAYAKELTKLIVEGRAINEIRVDVSLPGYYQKK